MTKAKFNTLDELFMIFDQDNVNYYNIFSDVNSYSIERFQSTSNLLLDY